MIDYFAIALTHGLIAFAAFRMLSREDLDDDGLEDGAKQADRPWLKHQTTKNRTGTKDA